MIETIHWHTLHPRYLAADSNVLDLGANCGQFARAVTERFGCHCVAVEPSPEPFASIPDTPHISKLQVGMAGKSGIMHFRIAKSSLASSFVSTAIPQTQTIEVRVVSLPELLEQLAWSRVDLIKINVGFQKSMYWRPVRMRYSEGSHKSV